MRRRPGFVLPAVLFALLVLSALLAGAWSAAFTAARSALLLEGAFRARAAAASATVAAIASWDVAWDTVAPGSAVAVPAAEEGLAVALEVRRTAGDYFALTGRAYEAASGARRSVTSFARLEPLIPGPRAVARLAEDPGPEVRARIDGRDAVPPGQVCSVAAETIMTVSIQLRDSVSQAPGLSPAWDWSRTAAWAASGRSVGDSLRSWFVPGDLVLDGERRAGLLVVDGDLWLRGGSRVDGIVLVRGRIVAEGRGGAVFGAVVAAGIGLAPGTSPASLRLVHSTCAVGRAGRFLAPARPVVWGVPVDRYEGY